MKKSILIQLSALTLVLLIGVVVYAQEDNALEVDTLTNIPNLTDFESNTRDLPSFLQNLYRYGIGIAAILAVVMITWGGFQYMMSEIPGVRTEKRARIVQAIFGLILVLLPVLVFTIINPAILDLDAGLNRVNTGQYSFEFEEREDFLGNENWGTCREFPDNAVTLFSNSDGFGGTRISDEEITFRESCCSEQGCQVLRENSLDTVGEETEIIDHKCQCGSDQLVLMEFNAEVVFVNEEDSEGFSSDPLLFARDFSRDMCLELKELSGEEQSARLLPLYEEIRLQFRDVSLRGVSGSQHPPLERIVPSTNGGIQCFDNLE